MRAQPAIWIQIEDRICATPCRPTALDLHANHAYVQGMKRRRPTMHKIPARPLTPAELPAVRGGADRTEPPDYSKEPANIEFPN